MFVSSPRASTLNNICDIHICITNPEDVAMRNSASAVTIFDRHSDGTDGGVREGL